MLTQSTISFKDNGVLFDPYSIDDVIFKDANETILATGTPVRVSEGVYNSQLDTPTSYGVYYADWTWIAINGMRSHTTRKIINLGPRETKIEFFSRENPEIARVYISDLDYPNTCKLYYHELFGNELVYCTEVTTEGYVDVDLTGKYLEFFGTTIPTPICLVAVATDSYGISTVSNYSLPGLFSLVDQNTLAVSNIVRSEDGTSVTFVVSGLSEQGIGLLMYTDSDNVISATEVTSNGSVTINNLVYGRSYGFILIGYVEGQVSGIVGFSSNYPIEYNYLNTGRGKTLPYVKVSDTFDANKRTQPWVRVRD